MYKYNHEGVGTVDISPDVKTEQSHIENETTVLDKILEKISNNIERKVMSNEEQEALDTGITNTNEENNLTCKFCPLDFSTEELLDNHATYQHQKKLFFCDQCSKNFTQSGNMRRHQKIHTLNNQAI